MATDKLTSTIVVMVGITGDLAQRYLLPALTNLAKNDQLPAELRLIGVSRRDVTVDSVLEKQTDATYLRDHLEMRQMDLDADDAYRQLATDLNALETELAGDVQRLFYLSVPPEVSSPIVGHLGAASLAKAGDTKVMMEKPFGSDLESAKQLVGHLTEHFDEDQIYRIDHYVAKEMVQNVLTLRHDNAAINTLWHGDQLEKVEVLASEALDIEGRATFYEQTGALRDLIQSHLLQILAHIVMEVPSDITSALEVRAARLAALQSLHLKPGEPLAAAKRGQYEGYRDEAKNPDSMTETFADLNLRSDAPGWSDVELHVVTGKALKDRLAHIKLTLTGGEELILRIQPDPEVSLALATRKFGYGDETIDRALTFDYAQSDTQEVNAYERVILDALRGDHHLFVSSDEVIASWEVIAPVQAAWANATDDMLTYPKGATPDSVVRADS